MISIMLVLRWRDVSNDCPIYGRAREWTQLDARLASPGRLVARGVRALAMSESHVRKVIDSEAVLWSIRLRIWGSEVRILPGAPDYFVKSISYAGLSWMDRLGRRFMSE